MLGASVRATRRRAVEALWVIGVMVVGVVAVEAYGVGQAGAQTLLIGDVDFGLIQFQNSTTPSLNGTLSLNGDYSGPASDAWLCSGTLNQMSPGIYQGSDPCTDSPGNSEGPQLPSLQPYGTMPSSFTADVSLSVAGSTWKLDATMGWGVLHCSGVVDPLSSGGGVQDLQGICTAG